MEVLSTLELSYRNAPKQRAYDEGKYLASITPDLPVPFLITACDQGS